jgi:hypothetical protein
MLKKYFCLVDKQSFVYRQTTISYNKFKWIYWIFKTTVCNRILERVTKYSNPYFSHVAGESLYRERDLSTKNRQLMQSKILQFICETTKPKIGWQLHLQHHPRPPLYWFPCLKIKTMLSESTRCASCETCIV